MNWKPVTKLPPMNPGESSGYDYESSSQLLLWCGIDFGAFTGRCIRNGDRVMFVSGSFSGSVKPTHWMEITPPETEDTSRITSPDCFFLVMDSGERRGHFTEPGKTPKPTLNQPRNS